MSTHINNNGNGNGSKFGELYTRYGGRLLSSMIGIVKSREKAEDITAKAFHIAFEKQDHFRGDASFYTWLYAIALNEARSSWRRKEGLSLDTLEDVVAEPLMVSDDTSKFLEEAEDSGRLQSALRRIPLRYRRQLLAHFVRGESVRQIAKQQGIPVGTVLSRLFKAKQLFRQAWKEVS